MTVRRAHDGPVRTHLLRFGIAWALAFAAAHVYWAFGGTVGVPTGAAPIGSRPAFLGYDVASAAVFVAAALVARRLVHQPTPLLSRLTTAGALVALARGLVGLVQDGAALTGGHGLSVGMAYDVWFLVAGMVFVAAGQATGTRSSRSPSARSPLAPARTPRLPNTTT